MKRKIMEIDETKCDGCGRCIPNCPEGALQLIDGKARLVSDLFCDGLGACAGECPRGALRVIEREAEPYDEHKVMDQIVRQGTNTIKAHLRHLEAHGEQQLLQQALTYLREHRLAISDWHEEGRNAGGCPGFRQCVPAAVPGPVAGTGSALRQWPIQLKLVNPTAAWFDGADLLVSADCVAHACGGFHRDLLAGRVLVVFCPKLDEDLNDYVEKLTEIFRCHTIRSITIARMEVPCCSGTTMLVKRALEQSGKQLDPREIIVGINGEIFSGLTPKGE